MGCKCDDSCPCLAELDKNLPCYGICKKNQLLKQLLSTPIPVKYLSSEEKDKLKKPLGDL